MDFEVVSFALINNDKLQGLSDYHSNYSQWTTKPLRCYLTYLEFFGLYAIAMMRRSILLYELTLELYKQCVIILVKANKRIIVTLSPI